MATDKNKIKELLGSGLSNDVVASAVGVTPAYIAQLLSQTEFADDVIELRTKSLTAANDRDRRIDKIEDTLIDKLNEAIDGGQVYKPRDLLHSFAVLNAARRRGVPATASVTLNQQIVQLILPKEVIRHFTATPQGEVIDITVDGEKKQTLVTMPSGELLKQLSAKGSENGSQYEKLRRFLPTPEQSSSGK